MLPDIRPNEDPHTICIVIEDEQLYIPSSHPRAETPDEGLQHVLIKRDTMHKPTDSRRHLLML